MNAVGSLLFQTLLLYSSLQIEHILTAALQKKMGVWPSLNFFPLPPPSVWQRSFSLFSPRCESFFLSKRLPRTFPGWLSPPLLTPAHFFPLRSPFQRGEKHTYQIQVGRHGISHPHQLLRTEHFYANKFVRIVRVLHPVAFFFSSLSWGGRSNSCWVSAWQNQLWFFEASAQICHPKNVNYQEGLLIPGSSNHSSPTMSSPDLHFGESVVVCVKFLQLKLKWRQSVNPQGCTGWITFCHFTAAWMPIQPWVAVAWHSLVDGPLMLLQSLEQHAKEEVEETEEVEE